MKRLLGLLVCILLGSFSIYAQDVDTRIFESAQSKISFEYPIEWMAVEGSGGPIIVVNDPTYLGGDGSFSTGQMRLDILPLQALTYFEPDTILQNFANDAGIDLDEPLIEFTINNRPAAQFKFMDGDISRVAITHEIADNLFTMIFVSTKNDETDKLLPVALDVIATMAVFEPELEAIHVDTQSLTQSYSAQDSSFSFEYPDGWELELPAEGDDSFVVLTNPESLHADNNLPDAILITLERIDPQDHVETLPVDEISEFIDASEFLPPNVQPTSFLLNGRNAARIEIDDDVSNGMYLVAMLDDRHYATLMLMSTPHTLDTLRPIVFGIIQTMQIKQLESAASLPLTDTYTTMDESYSLRYPADWFVREEETFGMLFLSTVKSFEPSEMQTGDIWMLITVSEVEDSARGSDPENYIGVLPESSQSPYNEPRTIQIGGKDAVWMDYWAKGELGKIRIIFVPDEDFIAVANIFIAFDDLPQYEATIYKILESITVLDK